MKFSPRIRYTLQLLVIFTLSLYPLVYLLFYSDGTPILFYNSPFRGGVYTILSPGIFTLLSLYLMYMSKKCIEKNQSSTNVFIYSLLFCINACTLTLLVVYSIKMAF